MKKVLFLSLLCLIGGRLIAQYSDGKTFVFSPDKRNRMEIAVNKEGFLCYRVLGGGKTIIDWSKLGLVTKTNDGGNVRNLSVQKSRSHREKFFWPLGESDSVDNSYNEVLVRCSSFGLEVRLYDGSAAFRYVVPDSGTDSIMVRRELTEFNLPGPFTIYQYNQESVFRPVRTDSLQATCDLPATLTDGHSWISIGEALNDDYSKAELAAQQNGLCLVFPRDSLIGLAPGGRTPWRTISMAGSATGLAGFSQLFLKLAPPPAHPDFSLIRPGKLIRAALTTQDGLDCIDFAASHNFQYILFDAGWYGTEFRSASDPAIVIPAIDMPAVLQHAKEKGIGVILYVNYVGLRRKLDTLLPLYKSWGISGLKFGFVDGLTQEGIRWLVQAIKKVNDYGFVLDIHDNYKPTGLSRTYPFLLSQEGIRGDENSPDAFHTTVLPFTRFLAGPADFTFCYPNSKNKFSKNLKVSKAQQLALTVVYFSPLQSIFWYGKPNDYTDEAEIEFFKYVPTVWDQTVHLAGEIGNYVSVARRKGGSWFIGSAAGPAGWEGSLVLDFLKPGRMYEATIYEDNGNQGLTKRIIPLKQGDRLALHLSPAGGQAVILR